MKKVIFSLLLVTVCNVRGNVTDRKNHKNITNLYQEWNSKLGPHNSIFFSCAIIARVILQLLHGHETRTTDLKILL